MKRVALRLTLSLALLAGVLFTAAAPSQAAPGCKKIKNPICPQIFDPVVCSVKGNKTQVFSNPCLAAAACATDCVPFNS
jgi:hypothetical protein